MLSPADVVRLARSAQARDVDVVVIGAGAAGLAAAQEAMRQGLTCVVVEAQGAVGGRASVDEKTFSIPFDRGGAWVHTAAENPLRAVAEKLGFTLVRDEKQLLAYDGDNDPVEEGRALEHEVERLAAHWQSLAERGVDIAGSSARLDGGKWADVAASVLGPLEVAVDVDQVSTLDFGTIMGEEADCFVKEGLGSVIASLRHGVPLRLEAPASALAWGKDGVVVTAGGEEFRGKRAIVTTSVGVLAKDTIAFEPPLPKWKRKAFDNVAMGVFNKIAFEFKDNVFGDVPAGARVRRLEAPEQPMEFVVRPFGSNMAVAFVGGSFARQLEERGSAAAIEHGLEVLEKLYGSEVRAQVKAATTTAWGSDPHTEGSYSAAKPGQQHMRRVLGEPVADRIYFAGEACHEEWAEHMAGAYLSGREAAQAIARKLKPSETTSTPTSTD
jgi:monoamine oxidase